MEPATKIDQVPGADVVELPSGSSSTLVVEGEHSYAPGQFLAAAPGGGAPDGFLLKVVSSTTSGGETKVQTEPGSLYEAVPNGEIDSTLEDLGSAPAVARAGPGAGPRPKSSAGAKQRQVPFNKKVKCEGSAEETLSGSLTIEVGPHLDIAWHTDLEDLVDLDEARATIDASVEAEVGASIDAEDECVLSPTTIAKPEWMTTILVEGVPVPVTVAVPIKLSGLVKVGGSASASVTAEARGSFGLAYENGNVVGIHELSSEAGFEHEEEANAELEARVGPDVSITAGWTIPFLGKLAAGLGVGASTGLKLTYDSSKDPPGTLCAPLTITGSLSIYLPKKTITGGPKILYDGNIKCVEWGAEAQEVHAVGTIEVTSEGEEQIASDPPWENISRGETGSSTWQLDGFTSGEESDGIAAFDDVENSWSWHLEESAECTSEAEEENLHPISWEKDASGNGDAGYAEFNLNEDSFSIELHGSAGSYFSHGYAGCGEEEEFEDEGPEGEFMLACLASDSPMHQEGTHFTATFDVSAECGQLFFSPIDYSVSIDLHVSCPAGRAPDARWGCPPDD